MFTDDSLIRGRTAFEREAWSDAYRELATADAAGSLEPDDLDYLATAAFLTGNDAASAEARARAHAGFLDRGDPVRAARSALWLAFGLVEKPASRAQAGGWFARARRLLDECGSDCAERGLLLCSEGFQLSVQGAVAAGLVAFQEAAAIGTRFRDSDVLALARHGQARCFIRLNRRADGLALLDEVMVAVTGAEVTPMVAGVVYCSVMSACYEAFDLQRAQEWTTALTGWCEAHPDMVPFRAQCMVRRAELMLLHGHWPEAAVEAQRASEWCAHDESSPDAGAACYQLGELCRLQGDFARADDYYRRASQAGCKPYPGLALLRLAQGEIDAAESAVRRMLMEIVDRRARARLLGACVEVTIARPDLQAARSASDELGDLARELEAPFLQAAAAYASGTVTLASGDVAQALQLFRQSSSIWQELDAPYDGARVRTSIGLAYRKMGDEDGAQMEFEAAQETFERLGAAADATRVEALLTPVPSASHGPLTGREVEVLRLAATGKTNRMIATQLAISEKTVARHMSNIFTKLDLPSRAAATAYAYEHKLV
jgi:DNA-binding CsgD family transcriptional regulator